MAKLISGKEVSAQIRQKIKEEAQALRENSGIQPGLAVILVGNDPASQIYVRNKQRAFTHLNTGSMKIPPRNSSSI